MMSEQTELRFTAAGPGSIEDRYTRWRAANPDLYAEIERRVLARANAGETRIELADVFSDMRRDLKVGMNHNHRSMVSRSLIADYPWLAGKIELRPRKSL